MANPPRPPIRTPRPSEGGGIANHWLFLIGAAVLLVVGFILLAYNMLQWALLAMGIGMLVCVAAMLSHRWSNQ